MATAAPALPTYRSAARFLERKNGEGLKLLGWTAARTIMIAPPFMLLGLSAKTAFTGALIASALISLFAVLRLYNVGPKLPLPRALAGSRRRR